MPFVTVGVFHDQRRQFVQTDVKLENINAIESVETLMGGPVDPSDWAGPWKPYPTRKVTLMGTHIYVHADDIILLR